jgi:hypothetical protein
MEVQVEEDQKILTCTCDHAPLVRFIFKSIILLVHRLSSHKMRLFVILIILFLLIMPPSLSCSGCKATTFTTQRGLTKHQSECVAYKRLQKKKISNLALPEKVEATIASTSGGPGFIHSETVEEEVQNTAEPKPPV